MIEQSDNTSSTTASGPESNGDGLSSPPEGNGTGEPQKANKEARYRVERNEARAERDALQTRIEQMQRAEVERLAGEHLSMASDLFSLSGNEVADYLTESGDVDAEKVAADVAAIMAERPGLRRNTPGYDPSQGRGGRTPQGAQPTFADLLKQGGSFQPY